MRTHRVLSLAAVAVLAACSDNPAAVPDDAAEFAREIVITQGIAAPVPAVRPYGISRSTLEDAQLSIGGSTTSPVSLEGAMCSMHPARAVKITYTVKGNQKSPASFKVYRTWNYNGSTFVGSNETTVNLPSKQGGGDKTYPVDIEIGNPTGAGTGSTSFVVAPFGLSTNTSDPPGQQLELAASSAATVYVTFTDCTPTNTAPSITIPADMVVEATSSAGASVHFDVTASDAEEGDLTSQVVCTPESGSTFPLGETTVICSVTDSGQLTTEGSFKVKVEDTSGPEFSGVREHFSRVATNKDGWTFSHTALGISAEDVGHVSEPVTITCDADDTTIAIGTTQPVNCTAKDARGNPTPVSFKVYVGLNVDQTVFLSPLRMTGPFSAHKRGSAIPHKMLPPRYADGTPAIDLEGGLRLVVSHVGPATGAYDAFEDDLSAGSTVWRYDATSGHYIFNLKSGSNWDPGMWRTTVSYAGVALTSTNFELKK